MVLTLELQRKKFQDFRNSDRNLIQSKTDRLITHWVASLSEGYKGTDIGIYAHIRVALSVFCAMFQYVEDTTFDSRKWRVRTLSPVCESKRGRFACYNLYNPMLIRIVNLFEPKEGASTSTPFGQVYGLEQQRVTSLVRLKPLNKCLIFRTEQPNHVVRLISFLKILTAQGDRKLKQFVGFNCFGFVRSVQDSKLIDELIESRTEVMGNFPDINTPVERRWRSIYFDAINTLTSFGILLCSHDTITRIFEKDILHQPKLVDLSLRSRNLEAWAVQPVHTLWYHCGGENGKESR
jgi:hypothetical protein